MSYLDVLFTIFVLLMVAVACICVGYRLGVQDAANSFPVNHEHKLSEDEQSQSDQFH